MGVAKMKGRGNEREKTQVSFRNKKSDICNDDELEKTDDKDEEWYPYSHNLCNGSGSPKDYLGLLSI